MSGSPCQLETTTAAPTRLWRNGMDFVPKKTYPPDYSNVPSVRDWQMSPFGNERYDLDEIQRAEKKGFKGRFELERLKNLYSGAPKEEEKLPPCPVCIEREKAKRKKKEKKCSTEYLYQPYGPSVVSSLSYSKPESNKPKLYSYMGPSFYSGFRFKVPAPERVSIVPCPSLEESIKSPLRSAYVPYGALIDYRITPDMYVPMGP